MTPPDETPPAQPQREALPRQAAYDLTLLVTNLKTPLASFESRGQSVQAAAPSQDHGDLLAPIITQHQGAMIQVGDNALTAAFVDPHAAVQAAIGMQRALRDHNRGQALSAQMHVCIGINSGSSSAGLAPETASISIPDEIAQVTARVEARALPDQILISNTTHEQLPDSVPCQRLGTADVLGTSIELYEVHWDERRTFQETVLLRSPSDIEAPGKVFVLEASRDQDRIKLSAHEHWPGEARPVKRYAYLQVAFDAVERDVADLVALLNRMSGRHGTLEADTWANIKARGEALYQQLLSAEIQAQLRASAATDLFLYIDDALVQIPWELMFDGEDFLCRRFNMGRIVSTQQAIVEGRGHRQAQALNMLIVTDPQGNLPAAAREGVIIQEALSAEAQRLRITLRRQRIDAQTVLAALPQYEALHYAGHADYDLQDPAQSGWRLDQGKVTARDILQQGQTAPAPALVFCNACQSGQTDAWSASQSGEQGVYGLANAFLLAGAQHYIGSVWEAPDEPCATFATAFYQALAQGFSVGEAVRHARLTLAERDGDESAVWASYVLYGDPTTRYLEPAPHVSEAPAATTAPEPAYRGAASQPKRRKSLVAYGVGAVLLLGLVVGALLLGRSGPAVDASPLAQAYQALQEQAYADADARFQQLLGNANPALQGQAYAGLAATAFAQGDEQQALDYAEQAERAAPDTAYQHVIRGHIYMQRGQTPQAADAYRAATAKSNALPWQQAIAYDRLGRIFASQGDASQALAAYDRAIEQDRDMATVYANKGHALEQTGNMQEAIAYYRKALDIDPKDPLTTMLLRDAERRQQTTHDREAQARIDQLVDALVQAYQSDTPPTSPEDAWTSRQLTLAFVDFQRRGGLSARAGEAEFVMLSLTHALRASGRVSIVEREVLDKVLAELKLSASQVVDAQAGLGRGKILAARLLAAGSMTQLGREGLLSIRLIETETTLINASTVQTIEQPNDVRSAIDQVAQQLLQDLRRTYPLRGRVQQRTGEDGVILNIGAWHGVTPGLVMQVYDDAASAATGQEGVHTQVGRIEVTHVDARVAQARILEQTHAFATGSKVQEALQP